MQKLYKKKIINCLINKIMAKLELKGTITNVGAVEQVGLKEMNKQLIVLSVPAYTDSFGDKKGNDEDWLLEIIGDNVYNLSLTEQHIGKRVKCTVFVESRLVTLASTTITPEKKFYQISAKLWKTEFKV